MSAWTQTVRLNPSQYRVLAEFAQRRGLSQYAMLGRVVEEGLLALIHGADRETDLAEMASVIGSISERLADAERVLDRTLFTACAAYAYARSSALGGRTRSLAAGLSATTSRLRRSALGNLSRCWMLPGFSASPPECPTS